MADKKLTALPAITDLADTDLVYLVDGVGGTPASKKITGADLKSSAAQTVADSGAYVAVADPFWFPANQWGYSRDDAVEATYPSGSTPAIPTWELGDVATVSAVGTTFRIPAGWTGFEIELFYANKTTATGQVNFDIRARNYAEGDDLSVNLSGLGVEAWEGTVTAPAQHALTSLRITEDFTAGGYAEGSLTAVRVGRRPSVESPSLPEPISFLGALMHKL